MTSNEFMTGTRVTQIELNVSSLARSLQYYHHDLGFTILEKTEGSAILGTKDFQPFLRLVQTPTLPYIKKQAGLYHFAILLPTRQDLGRFLRHLIVKQIPVTGSADHGVSEAFYLEDPDRNGIEVYSDRDHRMWYDEFKELKMFTKELDYPGLYYEAEHVEPYAGIPDGSLLGHIHLYVRDLAKSRVFYENAIGFHPMVENFPGALFLSDQQYHHHLGLNTWLGKGIPKRNPQSLGMVSCMIRFPNCETMNESLNNLKDLGFVVEETNSGYLTKDPDDNTIHLRLQES
ncbi:MAG: VOC family protein [Candidatus Izemoplasmatales bacterium]|jgi:catechol 2,3-dioxygenase|nr:VOC family protein [bacterium]MDZ4197073.1 VOC family protein [Candidatus Izemoplasmatales bacterium]